MLSIITGFMRKLAEAIRGLFMKASRFIMNTDYITTQNDSELVITLNVPGIFTIAAGETKIFKTTVTSKGSASKGYRCYFESTAFNYALTGGMEAILPIQNTDFTLSVSRKNDEFELMVQTPASTSARSFNTNAQVITAHIQTFVDPFQA